MYLTKTEGVVIKGYDYGEGHRIVVVFTKEIGKVRAVARGCRKTKSRFGASLEPLSENHFMLHRKPGRELYTLTGCKVLNSHSKIRDDMCLLGYGSIIAEGVDILCVEEDPDMQLYNLFTQALSDIENNDPPSSGWLFFFRLLKYAGYRLDFFRCVGCGDNNLEEMVFSPENGGVLCRRCSLGEKLCWPVSQKTLRGIKRLSPGGIMENDVEEEIGNIVKKFIKYQFNKDLKSLSFLNLFKKNKRKIAGSRPSKSFSVVR